MESPYVVVRDATPVDLFKILVDAVFPNVDVKTLANGKILQVAEDKLLGLILGFIVFDNGELKRTGYGHITSLFVNRIFRRKGHATRLVTNAETDLDKQGAAYVSVSVQKTDTDALLFFKKMGYEQEVVVTSNNIDGNDDANVIMTKKLKGKQFYSAEAKGSAPNEPHKVMAACLDGEEEENANVTSKMLKKQRMHPVETEGTRQAEEEVKAVTSKKQMADEVADKQKASKVVEFSSEESFDESEDVTIFVGNLSFKAQNSDIFRFFQDQKVVGVCLGYGKEKKPYAHVEFETEEDAKLALCMDGKKLLGRDVRLQKARKLRPNNSAESGGGAVRGYEKSHGEDEKPEEKVVPSKIGSAAAETYAETSDEYQTSEEYDSEWEKSPEIPFVKNVSQYTVLRNATRNDIFKILADYHLPDVDLESLENGKILQVIADDRLGAILGYIIFDVVEPKSSGHITSLFVNFIFRKEGVATRLVESAEMDLHEQGATYVSVTFPKTNTDASLFKKMGYKEEAVASNKFDGKEDANVIMTKKFEGKRMDSAETEGKRKAEEEVKAVTSKKQKVDEFAAKQKVLKVVKISSEESFDESEDVNPEAEAVTSKIGSAAEKKADIHFASSGVESFDEDEKPEEKVVPSKIGSAAAETYAETSDEYQTSEEYDSEAEKSPEIPFAKNVSQYTVLRRATPNDIFKILADYHLPDVDLGSLKNGKILQVIADDRLDAILGYIIFDVVEPKSSGHITSLFVNFIFRKEGVATRLVESAEMDVHEKGATYVFVTVPKTNTDALLFFEKMGYEAEAEAEAVTSNSINGKDDTNVIMKKKLEGNRMLSKTIYVGNLSFKAKESDIINFFQDCGKVVDVCLASHGNGKHKGFGRVEFANAKAAQHALMMNGQQLLKRAVRLWNYDAYTPDRRAGFYKPGLYQGKKTTFDDDDD